MTRVRESEFPMGISAATEIHTGVSISTDASGNGSATVSFDEAFNATGNYAAIAILTGGADGDVSVNSKATGSVDVVVTGSSTTSGSVTADVVVVGLR